MESKKYTCTNVLATTHCTRNYSRMELIKWMNDQLGSNIKKVEELCSGAHYLQLMDKLFPGCINLKRIKFDAKQEHEYALNLKLLQKVLHDVGCTQVVNISQMSKGKFQDNFEFLQWFRNFYHANDPSSVAEASGPSRAVPSRSQRLISSCPRATSAAGSGSQGSNVARNLENQLLNLRGNAELLEKERDFYYAKLRYIEEYCNDIKERPESELNKKEVVDHILAKLYATMEEDEAEEGTDEF